ncbi:MAG: DUF4385 family protein [Deltaproteobacteria bacterium]
MPGTRNLKQRILEHSQDHGFECIRVREIRAIKAALHRELGNGHQVSPSYIANVLRHAGIRVDVKDPYVDPWMEEPYASRLAGLLHFRNLEEAEASLHNLDEIFREYRSAADRVGTALVRELISKGKQRAEGLAANARVNPEKRREKEEIARWFKVWLDVSDLCFDWIEMRKQSPEFKQLFNGHNGRNGSANGDSAEN